MRIRGGGWILALAVLVLGARGAGLLPQGREPESLRLVTALAVDGGEEVRVTAVTGVRASEGDQAETFEGTGKTMAEACRALREGSSRRTYLGQTAQLLVGQDRELGETLDFVLTDRELRLDTLLYIVRGLAGEGLAASAERMAGEIGGEDPRSRTVGETLARLEGGECALIPALAADETGMLTPAGWAVAKEGGIAGYLEEDAALGAAFLSGNGEGEVASLPGGAVKVTSVRCWARDGAVNCRVRAELAEGEAAEEELFQWMKEKVLAALEPGWDCWGLDRELAALAPRDWEAIRGTDVRALDVEVTGRLVRRNERS